MLEQAKRNVHSILETLSDREGRGRRERERNGSSRGFYFAPRAPRKYLRFGLLTFPNNTSAVFIYRRESI